MSPSDHFDEQRSWFRRYLRTALEAAEPILPDKIQVVEFLLQEVEVEAARKALRRAGPPRFDPGDPEFVQQVGTTCMSTSLSNAMISLGEPLFRQERVGRVHDFVEHVVSNTSAFGKPGEYRSVDDLFKYLERGYLEQVDLGGEKFGEAYRLRLTNSLIDVVEALWTGKGRLVIQRRAHAHLAFGLQLEDEREWVLMRDPMTGSGRGYTRVSLETLRRDYLWSPLKKIPYLMGPHAFPRLSAEELLGHLERYDDMENLGVDCPSALVYRAADAPPLNSPPEPDDAAVAAGAESGTEESS